jgi:3-oxoadipate CoA-transferase alpha subunit
MATAAAVTIAQVSEVVLTCGLYPENVVTLSNFVNRVVAVAERRHDSQGTR